MGRRAAQMVVHRGGGENRRRREAGKTLKPGVKARRVGGGGGWGWGRRAALGGEASRRREGGRGSCGGEVEGWRSWGSVEELRLEEE